MTFVLLDDVWRFHQGHVYIGFSLHICREAVALAMLFLHMLHFESPSCTDVLTQKLVRLDKAVEHLTI